jgi:hypothetical protein
VAQPSISLARRRERCVLQHHAPPSFTTPFFCHPRHSSNLLHSTLDTPRFTTPRSLFTPTLTGDASLRHAHAHTCYATAAFMNSSGSSGFVVKSARGISCWAATVLRRRYLFVQSSNCARNQFYNLTHSLVSTRATFCCQATLPRLGPAGLGALGTSHKLATRLARALASTACAHANNPGECGDCTFWGVRFVLVVICLSHNCARRRRYLFVQSSRLELCAQPVL